jgi:hypothetical protein
MYSSLTPLEEFLEGSYDAVKPCLGQAVVIEKHAIQLKKQIVSGTTFHISDRQITTA